MADQFVYFNEYKSPGQRAQITSLEHFWNKKYNKVMQQVQFYEGVLEC